MGEGYLQSVESIVEEFGNSNYWARKNYLKKKLRKIPDQQIIEQIGMAEMSKIVFILSKKYGKGIELIPIEHDLMLRVGNVNVANMSYLAVGLHFLTLKNHILHIEGNISIPAGIDIPHSFYARVNGWKTDVKLQDCGLDLELGNEVYEIRSVFSMDLSLTEQQYIIEFFNLINGIECSYSRINSLRFAPVADCIKGQYCAIDDWIIQISGNQIVCHRSDVEEIAECEKNFQTELRLLRNESADWAIELRKKYFELVVHKEKQIWLIMDRSDRADDNGEIFFKYMQKHSDVDTYFVIDEHSKDYKRLLAIGNVASLYSEEHYLLALLADCVISSQCNGFVENPFWDKAEYFRDLYHRPALIFLQHGVIKDDMSLTLNRFHTNLRGFVTSTEAEYRSLLEYPYYYDQKNIWLTGLPVLDELENKEQRYIVIAPTWRKQLMHQEWDAEKHEMVWIPNENIKSSVYYKKYRKLLNDKRLKKYCERSKYKIIFKPHPLLEQFLSDITEGTDAIFMGVEKSYRDIIGRGSLLVTDYSSIAFDFAYLGKSTLYYQFDKNIFFSSHTYRKGYFDYTKAGFGEVLTNKWKLVKILKKCIEYNCVPKPEYLQRINDLFPYHDGACERIYKRINEI